MLMPKYDVEALSEKCQQNYSEIKDSTILVEVQKFLNNNPEPSKNLETLFIKRLTKIASHAIHRAILMTYGVKYEPNEIMAAYKYCIEGAERMGDGRYNEEPSSPRLVNPEIMYSHFYSHAGTFAEKLAEQTDDVVERMSLLEKAFYAHEKSTKIGENIASEQEHTMWESGICANIARALTELPTGEQVKWLKLSVENYVKTADKSQKINKEHSMITYSLAADKEFDIATSILGNPDDKVQYARNAITNAKKACEIASTLNEKHHAITCLNIGKFARFIYEITNNPDDGREAIKHYQIILEYCVRNPNLEYKQIEKMAAANIDCLHKNLQESRKVKKINEETTKIVKQKKEKSSRLARKINEELDEYFDE